MTFLKECILVLIGGSGGIIVSGGVFTVLIAVGLIPRFAGKTHTSNHVFLYENMVIIGTILGNLVMVFPLKLQLNYRMGEILLMIFGAFSGIFVGCLAIAIAEMLNSIPIFARRIEFRKGIGIALIFMAIGKMVGSFLYFY